MKVKRESSKIVRPCYEGIKSPPTDQYNIPLSHFDTITYNMHVAIVYAYRPPAPPNSQIEKGLALSMAEYREWAGRLMRDADDNPVILLNDKGVRFVEASVDCPLDKAMSFDKPSSALLSLHPKLHGVEELLQCQLTRFSCGSLVVGFTSNHAVADGHSTSNFLVAWGKACRGLSMEPLPLHGRAAFFSPRHPPRFDFEHRGVEYYVAPEKNGDSSEEEEEEDHHSDDNGDVVIHKAHFSKEFLAKLKARTSEGASRPYSTFESLQAHLWRTMTKARNLKGDETTQIRISVNGRQRLQPRIPNEYFGNLVLWAFPRTTVGELMSQPLQHAAKLIHDEVAKMDDSYFRSFIDFSSSGVVEEEGLVSSAVLCASVLCPNIEVDSWLRFPFYDLDFGGGSPFVSMPTYFPIEGMIFLLPSSHGDGSIDAFVPVFRTNLDYFKSICHSLEI